MAFSPDGHLLAAGGTAPSIRVWDTRTWREVTTFTQQLSYNWGLAFTPDGTRLATGGSDGILRLWDIPSRSLWTTLKGHIESAFAEGFLADGQALVSSSTDGEIKLWPMKQLEDGKRLTAHQAPQTSREHASASAHEEATRHLAILRSLLHREAQTRSGWQEAFQDLAQRVKESLNAGEALVAFYSPVLETSPLETSPLAPSRGGWTAITPRGTSCR